MIVSATASGLALIERTIPFAQQVTARTYGSLNAAEQVALKFLLQKMIAAEPAP